VPEGDTIFRVAAQLRAALVDQRIAAGIGNVLKSEVCWTERVNPFASVGTLDEAARRRIHENARRQLTSNLTTGRRTTSGDGVAVYRKAGRGCPRCNDRIRSRRDRSGRSTYWCPTCQPEGAPGARNRRLTLM